MDADASDDAASADELIELMSEEPISELIIELMGASELIAEDIGISELIADDIAMPLEAPSIGIAEALDIMSDELDIISDELGIIADELDIMSLDIMSLAIMPLDELSCAMAEPATTSASTAVDPTSADRKPTSLIKLSL